MIDYLIMEDNINDLLTYKNIIDKVMMNYDINYNISIIDRYTKILNKFLENDSFKVYLLHLEKHKKTKELIKKIREDLDDWKSLIIVIYDNIEILREKKEENFFIILYLNKNTNISNSLYRDIQICMKNYDQRPNSLKYCYKKTFYNIEYRNIIYIEKEKDNKICTIKTKENKYYFPGSLKKIEQKLDKRFIKCNKSYLINMEQVEEYNTKENIIIFKNREKVNMISRTKKKDIENYFRKII